MNYHDDENDDDGFADTQEVSWSAVVSGKATHDMLWMNES